MSNKLKMILENLNHVFIAKTNVHLPQTWVTLADFG